jgi:RNA polymerase sigma factor (sigma-70 family)
LVEAAQRGGRQAFTALVERYHVVVCSLAYALTGDLQQSEEIAQETFATAWGSISSLRQPERFRSWLYGITRNHTSYAKRSQRRQGRKLLQFQVSRTDIEPSALDSIISREEELVVARALERIPEIYRLPLVLFYREGQSVGKVADALDLSEVSVKKRLSRGRRMLQGEVFARLESALARTGPRKELAGIVAAAVLAGVVKPRLAQAASWRGSMSALPRAPLFAGAMLAVPALFWFFTRPAETGQGRHEPTPMATAMSLGSVSSKAPRFSATVNDPNARAALSETAAAPASARILEFDFEDGVRPDSFSEGELAPCPPRAENQHCMVGTVMPWWGRTYTVMLGGFGNKTNAFEYAKDRTVSFDYWHGQTSAWYLSLELRSRQKNMNYTMQIKPIVHKTWAHVEARLADFRANSGPNEPLEEGDGIAFLRIMTGRAGGQPFYVDNFRITDIPAPTASSR